MSEISKYLDLAGKYSKRNNSKKEIECWEKILEIRPNYAVSWIMIGKIYEKLKQLDKAIESYNKALEIDPTHRDALRYKNLSLISAIGDDETKIFEIKQWKLSRGLACLYPCMSCIGIVILLVGIGFSMTFGMIQGILAILISESVIILTTFCMKRNLKFDSKKKFGRFTCTNEKIDILFPLRRFSRMGDLNKRRIIINWSDIDTIKITKTFEYIAKTRYYTYNFVFKDKDVIIKSFNNLPLYQFHRKYIKRILRRLSAYMKSIDKTYIFDNKTGKFYKNIPSQFYVVVSAFIITIIIISIVFITVFINS